MKQYLRWLGTILMFAAILNFIIELISRKSPAAVFTYLVTEPFAFVLNILIIALPFTVVFITRRKVFACIALCIIWFFMGAANGVLLVFRTTPFTAADLKLVKYALNMITTYLSWGQIILLAGGSAAAVVICGYMWYKAPLDQKKPNYGIGAILIGVSLFLVLGTVKLGMETGLVAVNFGNIGQAYRTYGFPYCFSNSLLNTGISKPDSYDKETMEVIRDEELAPENTYELSTGMKPNIIMIQLESFFDPRQWENNPVESDPIPFFRHLMSVCPSGYLSVPSVGAGTANTEFEVITGMNLDFFGPGEYPYKTVLKKTTSESIAYDLKELGYSAHAIHNNEATFYDRHLVFSQLGFDTFIPIEYMYQIERNPTGWCKDKILTGEILKTLDSTSGTDFIYTISVQGHGAYPDFEYYCSQIGEMDRFIRDLVNALAARKEPTALVLYGDHLPGFEWTEEEMKNKSLYQTQYVVWNNMQLPRENVDVEAYQLSAHVLDMLGIHEGTMMRFHQNYLDDQLTEKERETYLEDMKVLEYDMLYGEHQVYDGESPYLPTDLQMGIVPISIDKIVYNKPNILVFGKNFNSYSKICLEGKALDTTYVWPQLIIAKDVPERKVKDATVTVRQIGRDKVPLGDEIGAGNKNFSRK